MTRCEFIIEIIEDPSVEWNVCRNTNQEYKEYGIGEYMINYTLNYLKINYTAYNEIYLYAAQKPGISCTILPISWF